VLSGAFGGSVVPIYGRLEIGRASTADLQLVSPEVSRSHAVIIVRPTGHVLVDLLSTNGTWIRGARVQEEHALVIGDHFRIGDSELAYEVMGGELAEASEVASERSHRTRRATDRVDFEVIARSVEQGRSWGAKTAEVRRPDGQPYRGNLLADITVYRSLRLKAVRDGAVPDDMKARFDELDEALRMPSRPRETERGAFTRFALDVPGMLIWEADPRRVDEVHVREIAADGATITAPEGTVHYDSMCWLSIPALGRDGSRRMLLGSRAVWSRGGELGLIFTGTAAPDDEAEPPKRQRADTLLLD
jgi:hypothetical protein